MYYEYIVVLYCEFVPAHLGYDHLSQYCVLQCNILMYFPHHFCFCVCRIPLSTYVVIAFLTVATMGLSNASLGYLNYPTQARMTCCVLERSMSVAIRPTSQYILKFSTSLNCYGKISQGMPKPVKHLTYSVSMK